MDINLECINCIIKKSDSLLDQYVTDKDEKLEYMKKIFGIISMSQKGDTSPYLSTRIMRIIKNEFNPGDIYYEIKKEYNNLLISMEKEILDIIYSSEDKLLAALKYAMVGNYIDFGAMDKVDADELKKLIKNAQDQVIDMKQYDNLKEDLKNAQRIAYITDNAGEIVFDKVFIKIIKEIYPDITVDVVVRGEPAFNDATVEDAEEVGLSSIANVIGNGTDIPGTQLSEINAESKKVIDDADLIFSKGQGNFESLSGCGKNIYYIFLCKCDLYVRRFNVERFTGLFINEKSINNKITG